MRSLLGDQYLWKCKEVYLGGALPLGNDQYSSEARGSLRSIAEGLIVERGQRSFAGFLQEMQYCVNLWTAHLILDIGTRDPSLVHECISTIRRYSLTPLNEELAAQEQEWLRRFGAEFTV